MIAVCVTVDIKPDQMEAFLPLMQAQAKNSLALESGCHHFDVCRDGEVANRVFLYELYTDRTAFAFHVASDHYQAFDAGVTPLIAAKHVEIFEKVTSGSDMQDA